MTRIDVRRLPKQRGVSGWSDILGPGQQFEPLTGKVTADFVVVGAGFAGLSAARRIQQIVPDANIRLLEAGKISEGAAGRNSGFMIDLPHELTSNDYAGAGDDAAVIRMNRAAIGFARDSVNEYEIKPDFFDECGKVNGAASQTAHGHNISYANHLKSLGEASSALDAQQMYELTGSRHYLSGLFTPGTVVLQPAGYIRGLANGLAKTGVNIHAASPVTNLIKCGTGWTVKTQTGQVATARVVLATNGHLESFGFARHRLMQIFLFASMTRELDADEQKRLGGAPRWGITPSDPMGSTIRRIDTGQGGNRIVTRTYAVMRPGMESTASDLRTAARLQQKKFDQRFPQLAGVEMQYKWSGHLCLSLNSVSVVGELEAGLYSACVQNGLGTARGTLTGMAAAELACGVSSDLTRHFLSEAPPRRLPPRPLREIGANAFMRWKEWRARAE